MNSQAGDFAEASRERSDADRGWEAIEAHRAFLEGRVLRMARTLREAAVTASDIVQGTLVEARRCADDFRGTTQEEDACEGRSPATFIWQSGGRGKPWR